MGWQGDAMHGSGVLTKAEGGTYTGAFWKGAKHGMGIEVDKTSIMLYNTILYYTVRI